MSKSIYILHLSDLHINSAEPEEEDLPMDQLCKRLKKFTEHKNCNLDLLLISGDLLSSKSDNYDAVKERINRIREASGLNHEQIFMTPGNHDVERKKCKNGYKAIINRLVIDPGEIDRPGKINKNKLKSGFESYLSFTNKYSVQKCSLDLPGYAYEDKEIHQVEIRLCSLNSALIAGPNDHGKTEAQRKNRVIRFRLLKKMLAPNRLNLVVSHYPTDWIHPNQQSDLENMLTQHNAIYFHGHRHKPKAEIKGVTGQLLSLGAGDVSDGDWKGAKHCQILEFNFNCSQPLLWEWFWFPKRGWRCIEPIYVSWNGWQNWQEGIGFCGGRREAVHLDSLCHHLGLINMGKSRKPAQRIKHFQDALECAKDDTEFIIVGRSLKDWSRLHREIEIAVNSKRLQFSIALLDLDIIESIIKPIGSDWAAGDVRASMENFSRINITQPRGSLKIYGLPFYVPRSFMAFTNKIDGKRYCSEEIGMARSTESRPFFEFIAYTNESFGGIIEEMHKLSMTEERLLLSISNGEKKLERSGASSLISKLLQDKIN